MATIVFFSIPAQGHVHPTLGVVRELTARGHRVVYYSYEGFREKIRAAGGDFVGCERLDPTMGLTRQAGARVGSDLALSTRVLVDTLLALDEPVCREMERLRPDCIVGDSMAVWAKTAAQKLGIPYEPVNPTEKMVFGAINEAVNRERLKTLRASSVVTVIIHIPGEDGLSEEEREYRTATLYKFLVDFRKEHGLSFSIDHSFDRFVAHATLPSEECTALNLQKIMTILRKGLSFPFSVGFGIHPSEQTSQYHAERALLESTRYGLNEGFLVSGEPEVLTGPLSRGQSVRYSYQDGTPAQLAHRLGIDNTNLLRLVGLYRNDAETVLTAAELAPLMGITLRSARRILQKLYGLGLVKPLPLPQSLGRGRPEHRYVFGKEAIDGALSSL